jgi:hypothetical protein
MCFIVFHCVYTKGKYDINHVCKALEKAFQDLKKKMANQRGYSVLMKWIFMKMTFTKLDENSSNKHGI